MVQSTPSSHNFRRSSTSMINPSPQPFSSSMFMKSGGSSSHLYKLQGQSTTTSLSSSHHHHHHSSQGKITKRHKTALRNYPVLVAPQRSLVGGGRGGIDQQQNPSSSSSSSSIPPTPVPFTSTRKKQQPQNASCVHMCTTYSSSSYGSEKAKTINKKNSSVLSSVMQQLTFHSMNPKSTVSSNGNGNSSTARNHSQVVVVDEDGLSYCNPPNSQRSSPLPSSHNQSKSQARSINHASSSTSTTALQFNQVDIKAPSRSSPKRDQNYQIFHFKLHNRSGSTSSSSSSSGGSSNNAGTCQAQAQPPLTSERVTSSTLTPNGDMAACRHGNMPLLSPNHPHSTQTCSSSQIWKSCSSTYYTHHHHQQPASCSSSASLTPSASTSTGCSQQQSLASHPTLLNEEEEEEPLFIILSPFREQSSESPLTLKIPSIKYLERTILNEPISGREKYCAASTFSFSSPSAAMSRKYDMEKIFKNYISEKEMLTSHLNLNSTNSKTI